MGNYNSNYENYALSPELVNTHLDMIVNDQFSRGSLSPTSDDYTLTNINFEDIKSSLDNMSINETIFDYSYNKETILKLISEYQRTTNQPVVAEQNDQPHDDIEDMLNSIQGSDNTTHVDSDAPEQSDDDDDLADIFGKVNLTDDTPEQAPEQSDDDDDDLADIFGKVNLTDDTPEQAPEQSDDDDDLADIFGKVNLTDDASEQSDDDEYNTVFAANLALQQGSDNRLESRLTDAKLDKMTLPELKETATQLGLKQKGVGWNKCCPPKGGKNDVLTAIKRMNKSVK